MNCLLKKTKKQEQAHNTVTLFSLTHSSWSDGKQFFCVQASWFLHIQNHILVCDNLIKSFTPPEPQSSRPQSSYQFLTEELTHTKTHLHQHFCLNITPLQPHIFDSSLWNAGCHWNWLTATFFFSNLLYQFLMKHIYLFYPVLIVLATFLGTFL